MGILTRETIRAVMCVTTSSWHFGRLNRSRGLLTLRHCSGNRSAHGVRETLSHAKRILVLEMMRGSLLDEFKVFIFISLLCNRLVAFDSLSWFCKHIRLAVEVGAVLWCDLVSWSLYKILVSETAIEISIRNIIIWASCIWWANHVFFNAMGIDHLRLNQVDERIFRLNFTLAAKRILLHHIHEWRVPLEALLLIALNHNLSVLHPAVLLWDSTLAKSRLGLQRQTLVCVIVQIALWSLLHLRRHVMVLTVPN